MSIENDIKDAFARHESDAEPRQGFDRVEAKVRRAHVRRLGAMSAFAVAAIVAGAVALTALPGDAPRGFVNPGATVSPSPSASSPTLTTYFDTLEHWQIGYPSDWRQGRFEAETEFNPPGLPGTPVGDDTFAVNVQLSQAVADVDGGQEVTIGVGNRQATRVAGEPRPGARQELFLVDWPLCDEADPCDRFGQLRITVFASTQALWDAHRAQVDAMLPTLSTGYGEDFGAGRFTTRHGTVQDETGGAATYEMIRFLEARIDGADAEDFLTDNAKQQYGSDTSGVGLYEDGLRGEPDDRWARYAVLQHDEVDANSSEYLVELTTIGGATVRERIGIGFEQGRLAVRFATREDA